ncbi:MAG: YciI family protein [Alphaproteobacteria bacterium]|jgi:hypothetical protein|nr:YciI family protein [Alphaproteobacteria bacterium]
MQFMALIYNKETGNHDPETFQAYGKFTQDMIAQGHFKSGDALQPTATATCLTIRDGKTSLKDGPFSETKEQLGGYYILECENLDEAIACAAQIPGAKTGTIEVRPVLAL